MRPFVISSPMAAASPRAAVSAATVAPAMAAAPPKAAASSESYFAPFRANIIGIDQTFDSPFGRQKLLYADWTATGRAYRPIETMLQEEILPFYANTHTEASFTGRKMTAAYEEAKRIIKDHVHATAADALIFCGSGMTSAVNKLQRIMGLRLPAWATARVAPQEAERPLVLVTHMEHHSNHISWLETIATIEIIPPDEDGNVDLQQLRELLERHRHRRLKIAAISACSNVTGIETPYHAIASIMHQHDGCCFVDFAASAPYTTIDMHPKDPRQRLDAIYFSGHKFLGGPGTPGILIFNKELYQINGPDQTHNSAPDQPDNARPTNTGHPDNSAQPNQAPGHPENVPRPIHAPDQPGGGTLLYTNPWQTREYLQDIEQREDGGTPPVLQAIKAGMAIRLKEEMGVANIRAREAALTTKLLRGLSAISGIEVLAPENGNRLGIVSFITKHAHYNTFVQTLNDRFGIQCRGGCSCAGTYGHFLLNIDAAHSCAILDRLKAGDHAAKPGWVRLSIHPTTTVAEIDFLLEAVDAVSCPSWQTSKPMISSL